MPASNLPFWEGRLVGPAAFLPTKVRTTVAPGPQIQPGDLVLLELDGPLSLALPDPRPCPGRMIAVSVGDNSEAVTWNAYPGTTVNGSATWIGSLDPYGGYIFVSTGTVTNEWRVVARFSGVT